MESLLIMSSLVFLAVAFGLGGLFLLVVPTRAEQRLQTVTGGPRVSDWTATVVKVAGPLARLSIPEGDWENAPLRLRFLHAGIRHPDARMLYFGAKTLLPLMFAALVYLVMRGTSQFNGLTELFYVMVAALIGCYLPNMLLSLKIKYRQREIFETFPDAVDLLLICIEAGLGMDGAMSKVTDEMRLKSIALAEELHLTNLEMRAGGTREKALRNLALRTGIEEIGTFATMLSQADKFGTSIGDSLRVFSEDLRHKRQVRAEETAAKIPTKLLFPLVLCIFPSIIMVVMGPAVVQVLRTLVPMLTGR